MTSTATAATAADVRAYYEDQGYEVRFGVDVDPRDGEFVGTDSDRVIYSRDGGETWLEGRWVSEYRVIDGQVVLA